MLQESLVLLIGLLRMRLAAPAVRHPLPGGTGGLRLLRGVGSAAGGGQGDGRSWLGQRPHGNVNFVWCRWYQGGILPQAFVS